LDKPSSNTNDISFVLKAYEECWEQARHVDEFMERMPRFFIIVAGSVIAGVAALIQFSKVPNVTFIFIGLGLIILSLIGFFASLTIPRYRMIRNSYFNSIYSLNKYFVDQNETLRSYFKYPLQIGGEFKLYYTPGIDFFRFMIMAIINTAIFSIGLYASNHSLLLTELFTEESQLMVSSIYFHWFEIVGASAFMLLNLAFYYLIIGYYKRKN